MKDELYNKRPHTRCQGNGKKCIWKKAEYQLQFNHEEDGLWYIDYPNWAFEHHNLLMVNGADELCAFLSDDDKFTKVSVIPSKERKEHKGYLSSSNLRVDLQRAVHTR